MSTFKEIQATFTIRNEKVKVVIKRVKSGCFKYGDESAHILDIYKTSGELLEHRSFDTRYDMISSDKLKWVEFWRTYLKDTYGYKTCELTYYNEEVD